MNLLRPYRRLRALLRRRQLERDMSEEIRAHLELQAAENLRRGMSIKEAREAAQRAFGGVEQVKERARDARGWRWLEDFKQDVRIGLRTLSRERGFAALCIVVLALGIGANTAIFSVLEAVLLRPLAVAEPERIMRVWQTNPARQITRFSVSFQDYGDWAQRSRSWELLGLIDHRSVNLFADGEPERLRAMLVTSNVPQLFGWRIARGRGFSREEDQAGKGNVAILSDGVWRRRFGADPAMSGRELTIEGRSYTVVGIMAPGVGLPTDAEILLPARPFASPDRDDRDFDVYGRLAPGVTMAQAQDEMAALARAIEQEHPVDNAGWSVRLEPLFETVVSPRVRRMLLLVGAAVGVLLLITCANLSSLLLVRATKRTRELAIRAALGGGRGRLVRQLTAESLLLAGMGGAAGLVLAWWSIDVIRGLDALGIPRADEVAVDGRVLVFAVLATLFTGFVAGVLPAVAASRVDVQQGLKLTAARTGGRRRHRLRNGLVVGQLALSLVLLASAGLLLRTVARLHQTDLGFQPEQVLTARLAPKNANARVVVEQLVERVRALPGVRAAGAISGAPMTNYNTSNAVYPVGVAAIPVTKPVQADWRIVTEGYFSAMQIPVLRGRAFTRADNADGDRVVLVNESLARLLWADADPIGKQINPGGGTRYSTVIGVVGDVRSHNPALPPAPMYFLSAHRGTWGPMTLVVRTSGEAHALIPQIRAELRALDATLPLFDVQTMRELVRGRIAPQQTMATLLTTFAGLALLLAAAGLYGVMAHATSQRTREIGIRMALGAQRSDILRPLLGDGARLTALGLVAGLLLAAATTRVMEQMLARSESDAAWDLLPSIAAAAVLVGVALAACYVPARRAMKVDPLIALRAE